MARAVKQLTGFSGGMESCGRLACSVRGQDDNLRGSAVEGFGSYMKRLGLGFFEKLG